MGRGEERGRIVSAQGGFKKGGKERKEEERKRKIPRSQKGGGIRRLFRGKAASMAMISKRRILVLATLGNSIDLITNF